jgi:hypothetical protein
MFLLIRSNHATLCVENNKAVAGGAQIQGSDKVAHGINLLLLNP